MQDIEKIREIVLSKLTGRLWHMTHPDRFRSILVSGAIRPEPDLPEMERWATAEGPSGFSYVRKLGGISVFDFEGFAPDKYDQRYPLSSWREFVPYRDAWGCAVWIELNRVKIKNLFISGQDLVARWKREGAYKHRLMPIIEAAYVGELSKDAFDDAFLVKADVGLVSNALIGI
ncbi:MAG: hypothetical protein P4L54_07850 [Acidocella sp.]|nr:hypothetical protein [Acidocella sp.]